MITKKSFVLLLLLITSIVTCFAQTGYEITHTSISEKFNHKDVLISKRIWATGKQGESDFSVELIINPKGRVMNLTINEEKIKPLFFKEYRLLTDYLIDYVKKEQEYVEPVQTRGLVRVVSDDPNVSKLLTDDIKKQLITNFKKELIADNLVENISIFQLMITSSALYINGIQQPESTFLKYKSIYDQYSPVPLSKKTYFQIMQSL